MIRRRGVRIAVAAMAVEVLGVLALVLVVLVLGPRDDPQAAQAYAVQAGQWVGPISGFALCLLGGYWVGGTGAGSPIAGGLILGLAAAALDIGILVAAGAPFSPLFALSNVGRVIAGTAGGWLRGRSIPRPIGAST